MATIEFELASVEEILRELGQRLRANRLQANLRQEELARRSGVSVGTVRTLETTGAVTLESLIRIVRTLGAVTELDLFASRPTTIAELLRGTGRKRARP
jgi:transcriptional regulator with XRE-family HTH domain